MTSKPDMSNPMISTPVAVVAAQVFSGLAARFIDLSPVDESDEVSNEDQCDLMNSLPGIARSLAEEMVTELQRCGHLPLMTETEEPAADDNALLLRAILFGLADWEPLADGDPRGRLRVTSTPSLHNFFDTKLEGGLLKLTDTMRDALMLAVAPRLRRL